MEGDRSKSREESTTTWLSVPREAFRSISTNTRRSGGKSLVKMLGLFLAAEAGPSAFSQIAPRISASLKISMPSKFRKKPAVALIESILHRRRS